jgi:hypothetical protein
MKRKIAVHTLPIIFGVVAIGITGCHESSKEDHVETMQILAFNVQFNYTLLNLVRSNQIEKVRTMLEVRTFLGLEDVWDVAGNSGILTNRVCNETFRDIYPALRKQIPLSRFDKLLLPERQSLTNFVQAVDRIFLTNDQSGDIQLKQ